MSLNQIIVEEMTAGSIGEESGLTSIRETAEQYARIFVQPKRAGTPIPDNDLWIAAQVLECDLVLITRDRYFQGIPTVDLRLMGTCRPFGRSLAKIAKAIRGPA